MTRLLIVIICILILWLALMPVAAQSTAPLARATWTPVPTAAPRTPAPTMTAVPAYPAPNERRAPRATPGGLRCQRCDS